MKMLAWLGLGILGSLVSCVTINDAIMAPPHIPGAEFVGSDSCTQCHENITDHSHSATHSGLKMSEARDLDTGCETCHGPGSVHVESGGEPNTIVNPDKSPETCFQCHLDMRGRFSLPFRHPVSEGKMGCGDCHNPHHGPAVRAGGTTLLAQNETCTQCHTAQRGPHVFEHEASREGCITCHDPHGSVNNKLLTERNANLCLKCHFQQQTGAGLLIGGRDHTAFLTRGTCWTAGCHEAVHGSQVNSSLRF
jgi:predicted CXXCH cytochrome family protein